jgi:hypothetical protein
MFVVGHTPGGAPFGCFEDELEDLGSLSGAAESYGSVPRLAWHRAPREEGT